MFKLLTVFGAILPHPGAILHRVVRVTRDLVVIDLNQSDEERIQRGVDPKF